MADLDSTIDEHAAAPAEVSADGVTVKEHGLPDQIAADKHLAAKSARAAHPRLSFSRVQLIPPGAA